MNEQKNLRHYIFDESIFKAIDFLGEKRLRSKVQKTNDLTRHFFHKKRNFFHVNYFHSFLASLKNLSI